MVESAWQRWASAPDLAGVACTHRLLALILLSVLAAAAKADSAYAEPLLEYP